jgi:hypothetical protein
VRTGLVLDLHDTMTSYDVAEVRDVSDGYIRRYSLNVVVEPGESESEVSTAIGDITVEGVVEGDVRSARGDVEVVGASTLKRRALVRGRGSGSRRQGARPFSSGARGSPENGG